LGVTAVLRDRLLAVTTDDLSGLRDRALVAVSFDTLCRRGELVALHFEDIEPNHFGTASLLIRLAKNDPEEAGRIAHLTPGELDALTQWIDAAHIEGGPLFRQLYGKFAIDRFRNPIALARILKKLATQTGFGKEEVFRISGHSLRIGAAQQLTIDGVQLLPIMRAGG